MYFCAPTFASPVRFQEYGLPYCVKEHRSHCATANPKALRQAVNHMARNIDDIRPLFVPLLKGPKF